MSFLSLLIKKAEINVCVCAESCRTEGRKRQAERSEVRMETLPVSPVSMAVKKTRQWFSFYLFIIFLLLTHRLKYRCKLPRLVFQTKHI